MKNLANYTLDEMKEKYKDIPYYIIDIVYGYFHRDRTYTVDTFAYKNNISTATLYRYVNIIKRHQ